MESWFLTRDQALSLWSGSTDSQTLDYQRTNPAAAAKYFVMADSVRPHRWQPTRLPRPWDSPGKNTGVGCHLLLQCMKVKSESEVAQSCPTLSDPMDSSWPGSSTHGVFQARVLEWDAIAFSGTNPREYQIMRTHTKETTWIQNQASPNHQYHPVQDTPSKQQVQFSSVQSLSHDRLFATQHARPPCPSPTPGLYSNSCPSSRWCHPTISSSVVIFSSCPQSLPASGSFQMSQLFAWGVQSIGVSASPSVLPMNIQDWSPLGWTGWISLQSKGLTRVLSNTRVHKHQFFGAQLSSPSNSHIHTWPLEKL